MFDKKTLKRKDLPIEKSAVGIGVSLLCKE